MRWIKVTLQNRSIADLYLQETGWQECGPSCLAIMGRLNNHYAWDITTTRRAVDDSTAQMARQIPAGYNWSRDPSFVNNLVQALTTLDRVHYFLPTVRKDYQTAVEYKEFCENRSTQKPALLRLDWSTGGGHFVVTVGKNGNARQNFIEILDPYYGYQTVSMTNFPTYKVYRNLTNPDRTAGHDPFPPPVPGVFPVVSPVTVTLPAGKPVKEGTFDQHWSISTIDMPVHR
jgi:hypothetical protein